jgi:hypothetical protein
MITHTFQTNKLSRRSSISTLFAHMHYFVATSQATTTMTKHTLLLVVIELAIVNNSCYTFVYYVSIGRQGLLCSYSCSCFLSASSSSSLLLSSNTERAMAYASSMEDTVLPLPPFAVAVLDCSSCHEKSASISIA